MTLIQTQTGKSYGAIGLKVNRLHIVKHITTVTPAQVVEQIEQSVHARKPANFSCILILGNMFKEPLFVLSRNRRQILAIPLTDFRHLLLTKGAGVTEISADMSHINSGHE